MTINKDDYYLKNIDLLRKLEPVMKKKGIEADYHIDEFRDISNHDLKAFVLPLDGKRKQMMDAGWEYRKSIDTWRKDSLEAALPEWCFNADNMRDYFISFEDKFTDKSKVHQGYALLVCSKQWRGQKSLEALAQLVILLDEEGINE